MAFENFSALTITWTAAPPSTSVPRRSTMTGWSSTVSAGMVTLKIRLAACHTPRGQAGAGHEPAGAARAALDGQLVDPHALGRLGLGLDGVGREVGVLVQAAHPLERGEPPDLLASGGDGVVLHLEGAFGVEV